MPETPKKCTVGTKRHQNVPETPKKCAIGSKNTIKAPKQNYD